MLCQERTPISQTTRRKLAAHNRGHTIVCIIGLESATSHSLATKYWSSMLRCQVAEAERARFGIYFAILISLSTSSTTSTFVAVANNLQSKVAMALVSLSGVAVFFDDDVMLMASAMKMPMICVFFFGKRARHGSAWCTPG